MTEKDKDILIEKMIDSPSSLADEELRMIMLDDELKDVYDVSSVVKSACLSQSEIDVDREWRLFRHRILPKPSPRRWMMRVAAIFLGVMMASGTLVKIADYILTEDKQSTVADAGRPLDKSNLGLSNGRESHTIDSDPNISVLTGGAEQVLVLESVSRKNSGPEADDIEVEEEIDVEKYLRQQQTEIDNEIALLNAEIYLDELDAISEFMGYINADNTEEINAEILIQ